MKCCILNVMFYNLFSNIQVKHILHLGVLVLDASSTAMDLLCVTLLFA